MSKHKYEARNIAITPDPESDDWLIVSFEFFVDDWLIGEDHCIYVPKDEHKVEIIRKIRKILSNLKAVYELDSLKEVEL